jgi:hypothetical protein
MLPKKCSIDLTLIEIRVYPEVNLFHPTNTKSKDESKAVVAEPHFPQANLQFCQSIHGKPWTPPWLNPAGTDLVLPFSHEITLECRYFGMT